MLVGFTSRKEISNMFQCGTRTTRRILREIGITHRLRLTPIEVAQFQNKVGELVRVGDSIHH